MKYDQLYEQLDLRDNLYYVMYTMFIGIHTNYTYTLFLTIEKYNITHGQFFLVYLTIILFFYIIVTIIIIERLITLSNC